MVKKILLQKGLDKAQGHMGIIRWERMSGEWYPSCEPPFWIGDREFTADDLAFIKAMVWEFRHLSRTELAATIAENLPWKAPNGRVKLNGCRLLLEEMANAGLCQKGRLRRWRLLPTGNSLAQNLQTFPPA